jgi:hypothetical protein
MFRALTTLLVVLATLTTALAREPLDWVPYVNDRFGFSLRIPPTSSHLNASRKLAMVKSSSQSEIKGGFLWALSRTARATTLRAI